MVANPAFGLFLAFGPFSIGRHSTPNAYEMFCKSSSKTYGYNVRAVIEQRDPLSNGVEQIKVFRNEKGEVYTSVVSPLRMQGVESLDDGKRWRMILPDDKTVLDQESPSDHKGEVKRLELAKRNYHFSFEDPTSIAGRTADVILASPSHPQMPSYRFSLDRQNGYPLKLESLSGGRQQIEFVTREIDYPKRLDRSVFDFQPPMGYQIVNYDRHRSTGWRTIQRDLSFIPVEPKTYPLGFSLQDVQINRKTRWHSLVLRLSDGIARATVYEYTPGEESRSMHALENSIEGQVGDVHILVVSGIEDSCRKRLLESFITAGPMVPGHEDFETTDPLMLRDLELSEGY